MVPPICIIPATARLALVFTLLLMMSGSSNSLTTTTAASGVASTGLDPADSGSSTPEDNAHGEQTSEESFAVSTFSYGQPPTGHVPQGPGYGDIPSDAADDEFKDLDPNSQCLLAVMGCAISLGFNVPPPGDSQGMTEQTFKSMCEKAPAYLTCVKDLANSDACQTDQEIKFAQKAAKDVKIIPHMCREFTANGQCEAAVTCLLPALNENNEREQDSCGTTTTIFNCLYELNKQADCTLEETSITFERVKQLSGDLCPDARCNGVRGTNELNLKRISDICFIKEKVSDAGLYCRMFQSEALFFSSVENCGLTTEQTQQLAQTAEALAEACPIPEARKRRSPVAKQAELKSDTTLHRRKRQAFGGDNEECKNLDDIDEDGDSGSSCRQLVTGPFFLALALLLAWWAAHF